MSTAVVEYSEEQVGLIKRTIAKGASDDELALFLQQCKRTGLDPFSRQIHAVKRWDGKEKREVMTMQVGIDGFRLIAERTDRYAPGREPTYTYDADGALLSATAYVKKLAGGTWHEVARTAFWKEFVQTTKDGQVTRFWSRMPHLMLGKCAESMALRAAFPMELSGLYTPEEMTEVELVETSPPPAKEAPRQAEHKPAPATAKRDPADGAALEAEIDNLDKKWSAAGFCKRGELLTYVRTEGVRQGLEPEIVRYTLPRDLDTARKLVSDFGKTLKNNKPAEKAPDVRLLITPEQLSELEALLVDAEKVDADVMKYVGKAAKEPLASLTGYEYRSVMKWLNEQLPKPAVA